MPPAVARSGDPCSRHQCSAPVLVGGSGSLHADGRPVHRVGDSGSRHAVFNSDGDCTPPAFHSAAVVSGSNCLSADGRPVTIVGSPLRRCATVVAGSPSLSA